jgi:tRNA(fMet)-specific endonuclease VapC
MLILDTDHLTAIDRGSEAGRRLRARPERADDDAVTTIVSAVEQLRGLLALIASARREEDIVARYERLELKLVSFRQATLLSWTDEAGAQFRLFRRSGLRIGTMDLRIACIAIANDATLLSRNLGDFRKVPGLRVEDWLA